MSGEESVEEIARAAVALCADLLRRYEPVGSVGLMVRTPMTTRERFDEWGRQVLAWQDQLDDTEPDPELPPPPAVGDLLIISYNGRSWCRTSGVTDSEAIALTPDGPAVSLTPDGPGPRWTELPRPDPPDCPAQQTGEATDCICTDAGACGELHARRTMDARRARRA